MDETLAITPPGGAEWLVILLTLAVLAMAIGGLALLMRRAGGDRAGSAPPRGQQPPVGYWWDGAKWNPPGEPGE